MKIIPRLSVWSEDMWLTLSFRDLGWGHGGGSQVAMSIIPKASRLCVGMVHRQVVDTFLDKSVQQTRQQPLQQPMPARLP